MPSIVAADVVTLLAVKPIAPRGGRMNETASADRSRPSPSTDPRPTPHAIELWRLRGATDDLRGLAIETSYGYALGLELDTELVLLHLQPSLDALAEKAERIEAALMAQGWRVIPACDGRSGNR
jgi:hypothetical protein